MLSPLGHSATAAAEQSHAPNGAELGFSLDASKWKVPPVFKWLGSLGNVAQAYVVPDCPYPTYMAGVLSSKNFFRNHCQCSELVRTFNMGIGMVALVAAADAASVMEQLQVI